MSSRSSFLKHFLDVYRGKVLIYEVLPLRFTIGSGGRDPVKLSRNDPRTGFFETLVIDALGYMSFNTAPGGNVIDSEESAGFLEAKVVMKGRQAARKADPIKWSWHTPAAAISSL